MKEDRDCRIIQDLLPSYIEDLTNEGTNKYVEEHLINCKVCKELLENMQREIELNTPKQDKREIKYIKKFKNKMRVLKIILLLIVFLCIIVTSRKMIIISKLQSRANEYTNSINFHRIIYSYAQDTYIKSEIFCLDNKKLVITTTIVNGEKIVRKIYSDGEVANIYTETVEKKMVKLNQKMQMAVNIYNSLYTENWWHLLISSLPATINTKEYNGKECYYITNYVSPYMLCQDGAYIDKETGLVVKTISTTENMTDGSKYIRPAMDYVYEFDTVTENRFIEPYISEYEIE